MAYRADPRGGGAMSGNPPNSQEDGFSLIEVLVAFIIVTLGLVSFYAALALHLRQMNEASMRNQTTGYALSQIEEIGNAIPVEAGTASGSYPNGARWRLSIRNMTANPGSAAIPARPLNIDLEIFDPRGRPLTRLKTIKLAPVRS